MLFGQPQYLPLLSLALLPLLVHLLARRQRRVVPFSMTRFLQEVAHQTQGRRWLRELLLVLLRTGAVLFALLALLRPYASLPLPLPPAPTALVFILDNSLSMQSHTPSVPRPASLVPNTKQRWFDLAKAWCQRAVQELRVEIAILAADKSTEPLCSFTASPAERQRALERVRPTFKALDLTAALQTADALLVTHPAALKSIVVITDGQSEPFRSLRLPSLRHPVTVVDVKAGQTVSNARVTARLRFPLDPATDGAVVVEVQDLSPQTFTRPSSSVPRPIQGVISLLVAGKTILRLPLEVASGAKEGRTLSLPAWAMDAADEQGIVWVQVQWQSSVDIFHWDDRVAFAFKSVRHLKVVNAVESGRQFVDAALRAVGITPMISSSSVPRPSSLDSPIDVLLTSAPATQEAAQALVQQWKRGCGVVIFADRAVSPLWALLNLSVRPHPNQRRLLVEWMDERHALLSGLGATLRGALVQPTVTVDGGNGKVLVSLSDGSPLLLDLSDEQRRCFVVLASLDAARNGTFVRSPAFVPLLHRLVRVAAYGAERQPYEAEAPPQANIVRSTSVPESESDFRLPSVKEAAKTLRAINGKWLPITQSPQALLEAMPLRDLTFLCLLLAMLCLLTESVLTLLWWRRAR